MVASVHVARADGMTRFEPRLLRSLAGDSALRATDPDARPSTGNTALRATDLGARG